MDIKQILGRNIKKYRKAFGYTQMQFAEIVGVDQKHISFIESGNSYPSASLVSKISEALKVKPRDLFDYEEKITIEELKKKVLSLVDELNYEDLYKVHNYVSFLFLGNK